MDNSPPPPSALNNFRILYLVTQLVGITIIILVSCWIGIHLNGLGWSARPSVQFNWHPLLMSVGMIFLYGNCKTAVSHSSVSVELLIGFLVPFFFW